MGELSFAAAKDQSNLLRPVFSMDSRKIPFLSGMFPFQSASSMHESDFFRTDIIHFSL